MRMRCLVRFLVMCGLCLAAGCGGGTDTAVAPATPAGLVAMPVSLTQINLSWTDTTGETSYKIERKSGVNGTYARIAVGNAGVTSYYDTSGLTASTTYYYRILASNSTGDSGYSAEATATTTPMVPEMVQVSGGIFTMGNNSTDFFSNDTALPTHQVTVRDFSIGKFEVTQGEWSAVMGSNPSYFLSCGLQCPVEQVSWEDIQTFIARLNLLSGKTYRLPTEAEWEYAARGVVNQKFAGTDDVNSLGSYAWFSTFTPSEITTHSVGGKSPNQNGLYDMSGNVWEWVNDYYGPYSSTELENPPGPLKGDYRVNRGGGWIRDANPDHTIPTQVFYRGFTYQYSRSNYIGFRLAL